MVSREYYHRFKYVFFIVFRTTFTGVPVVAFPAENGLNYYSILLFRPVLPSGSLTVMVEISERSAHTDESNSKTRGARSSAVDARTYWRYYVGDPVWARVDEFGDGLWTQVCAEQSRNRQTRVWSSRWHWPSLHEQVCRRSLATPSPLAARTGLCDERQQSDFSDSRTRWKRSGPKCELRFPSETRGPSRAPPARPPGNTPISPVKFLRKRFALDSSAPAKCPKLKPVDPSSVGRGFALRYGVSYGIQNNRSYAIECPASVPGKQN